MESNCQFAGAFVSATSSERASEKFLFMRGQNSGSGQLVKKKVNATARPRKSEKCTTRPFSLVNSQSGNSSPALSSAATTRHVGGAGAVELPVRWMFSIQSSSALTTRLKVISSPGESALSAFVLRTEKSIVIAVM